MDNDAFKKMVRNRGGKSTKEIARAAVEQEFRKRRKGRKRQDDDYESSDSDNDNRRKKKKNKESPDATATSALLLRPTQVKVSEEEASKYRDRAKERREAGNADTGTTSTTAGADDDPNVPLPAATKGLDLSLVREEKARLRGDDDDDDDDSDAPDGQGHQFLPTAELPSIEQARRNLEQFLADPSSSFPSLSAEETEYLTLFARSIASSKSYPSGVKCGVEGKTLQRTRLVLSMDGHPSDRRRAWEIPREAIHSNASEYPNIPLLPEHIVESLEQFFPVRPKKAPKAEPDDTTARKLSVIPSKNEQPAVDTKVDQGDDDDDDDIFAGLDDYIPPDKAKVK